MKSTSNEMDALLSAFQLPTLHPDIPIQPIIAKTTADAAGFAKALLAAKVIQPRDIPHDVFTAEGVVQYGLGAWFKRRTKSLRMVDFDLFLQMGQIADDTIEMLNMNGGAERVFHGRPILVLAGGGNPYYRMDLAALKLESQCKGLFAAVYRAVEIASYKTVPLRLPPELWETVNWRYWDCDSSDTPTDEEARETLAHRFGEDDQTIENYLPSALRPTFGGTLCIPNWQRPPRNRFGRRKVAYTIANHPKASVRKVAILLADLRKATERARSIEACLPDLCGLDAICTVPAASLLFKPEGVAYEVIDDLVEDSYNAGDATDVMGVAELPVTPEDLSQFFYKLDVAFDVLTRMDRLISYITNPANTHYE